MTLSHVSVVCTHVYVHFSSNDNIFLFMYTHTSTQINLQLEFIYVIAVYTPCVLYIHVCTDLSQPGVCEHTASQ